MNDENKWTRTCSKCGKTLKYKSRSAWALATKKGGLCKSCAIRARENYCADLSVLLDDTPETFYWIGFLLADGCFGDNRIRLSLSIKDKEHVLRFGNFIKYNGTYTETDIKFGLACKNITIVEQICKKFDINQAKTYNPPETIMNFDENLRYALLAGFIDGDGNIQRQNKRADFLLRIKNHASWLNILKEFGRMITDKECVKLNGSGYAELNITNTVKLQELKRRVMSLNLPLMSRKWDVIDLNFVSKYTTAEILRNKVLELHKQGYKNIDICRLCNTSPANVSKIIKKYYNNDN